MRAIHANHAKLLRPITSPTQREAKDLTLIRLDGAYEAWPRYPRTVTPEQARAIAVDLERKLDVWIEETRAAGQAGA